ncbi:hypothetical protein Taro_004788 [Colocasia esculenta]|uniref:Uncharacterized protein n=1 Tax=Colocasia esculenta TaxID=4460 RepID=A0A843TSN0_COLES|nr:hypothetical protein [Colocasia esculenta]
MKLSGPLFFLKEMRIARYFQLCNDFRYLNKLPEVQFGQFHGAITTLRAENTVNYFFTVDFTTLKLPEKVFLPKQHSLVFDYSAGSHAFDRFARVMGRISAQQCSLPSFQRFIFREFHLGHISFEVLAPLISECERLSPIDWEKHYNQYALRLESLNSSFVKSSKPPLSVEAFLDLNSNNPVQELFVQWVEWYKPILALRKDLLQYQIHYPVNINNFFVYLTTIS